MSKPILWTSIAAVLVSSASLAASGWVIANERSGSAGRAAHAPAPYQPYSTANRNVVEREVKDDSKKAVAVEPAAKAPKKPAETKAPAKPAETKAPVPNELEPADLKVKRLVVASGVQNREPVGASDTFEAGDERVYAFVELANRSSHDGGVVLVFENGTTRAGLVELDVPADVGRWRTWGYTRGLRQPGTWNVVVREQVSGKELARTTIEVEAEDETRAEEPAEEPTASDRKEPAASTAAAVVAERVGDGMI